MGELVVSEKSIEYDKNKSSDELLLRIFKETYKEGIIVIDNEDNILFINDEAKKLIGPLLQDNGDKKINLPYSISKERVVHLKVNPSKYRSISINASKLNLKRKKYHLLKIKKVNDTHTNSKGKASKSLIESSKNFLHYQYDFETKKFILINSNLKKLLDLNDTQTDLRASIVEKIHSSDQQSFIDVVNEIENSEEQDIEKYYEIYYRYSYLDNIIYIYDRLRISKIDGKLKNLESNSLILNDSLKFVNNFSENDHIQKIIGNNLTIGLYKIDLIKKTFEISDNFYKFIGYNKHDIDPLFDNFKTLIHPDDVDNYILGNKDFLANRDKFFTRVFRVRLKNGTYKWIESRGTIYSYDEIGQPSKIIGFMLDKSNEMNIFNERDYFYNLFTSLMNYSNDIFFVVDEKGKLYHLSQSVERLTGVKNEEFLNKHLWDTLMMTMSDEEKEKTNYEYHKSTILDALRNTLQNGSSVASQSKHYSKNGNEFYLETVLHPLYLSNNPNPLLIAISKDITGLKIIQDELKEKEIIYNEFMDNSTDAIVAFEPENEKIIYANNVAAKLYGLTKEELINKSMVDFSIDTEFGKEKVQETINKKGIITFKSKHKTANGKIFQVQITGSYINFNDKNVILSINKFIKYIK